MLNHLDQQQNNAQNCLNLYPVCLWVDSDFIFDNCSYGYQIIFFLVNNVLRTNAIGFRELSKIMNDITTEAPEISGTLSVWKCIIWSKGYGTYVISFIRIIDILNLYAPDFARDEPSLILEIISTSFVILSYM